MKRPAAALPAPEQIAETPEQVALSGLDHAIELTIRTLIGVCPGRDDAHVSDWLIEPSKAQREAHPLVTVACHLRQRIEPYLAVLDVNRRTGEARLEDDLPF